ncbi:MAG: S8 family serine peptidase [Hyphomicrobiales bacterium]
MKTYFNWTNRGSSGRYFSIALFSLLLVFASACKKPDNNTLAPNNSIVKGKYIVTINSADTKAALATVKTYKQSESTVKTTVDKILASANIPESNVSQVYSSAIVGFAAKLSEDQLNKLKASPLVVSIDPDRNMNLQPEKPTVFTKAEAAGQVVPWGITRIGGSHSGVGKRVWVIDTGIDLDHPDLNVDQNNGANFCSLYRSNPGPNDDNGHGSHVAGTIAAKDNGIGVVGVAAGATVVPVKVVDQDGAGYESDIAKGVDYVSFKAKKGEAVNMSLGTNPNTILDQAVKNAAAKGILFAIAAGNEHTDARNSSPQRVSAAGVYKVAAFDKNDKWAYFSNYGPYVQVAAPGVAILSTYKDGKYATLDGTSMASPHVAGLLALEGSLYVKGNVYCDRDGKQYPVVIY